MRVRHIDFIVRDPDGIGGGTWEAFERVMRPHGYFEGGLRKLEIARMIGAEMDPGRNRSRSFQVFREVLVDLVGERPIPGRTVGGMTRPAVGPDGARLRSGGRTGRGGR